MFLLLPGSADEAVHLLILSHARGELCSQMDESFLKGRQSLSRSPRKDRLPDEALARTRLSHGGTKQTGAGTHRAGPYPEILLLDIFHVLIYPPVFQDLPVKRPIEERRWEECPLTAPPVAEEEGLLGSRGGAGPLWEKGDQGDLRCCRLPNPLSHAAKTPQEQSRRWTQPGW